MIALATIPWDSKKFLVARSPGRATDSIPIAPSAVASTISKSDGETITSRAGDLTPVLLVPHTYAEYLNEPSVMAVIDFGRDRQCRLKIIFQSKTSAEDRGAG